MIKHKIENLYRNPILGSFHPPLDAEALFNGIKFIFLNVPKECAIFIFYTPSQITTSHHKLLCHYSLLSQHIFYNIILPNISLKFVRLKVVCDLT